MGILDKLLKRRQVQSSKLIQEPVYGFSSYSGDAYSSDVYREGVDAIARNAAKLKGAHIVNYGDQQRKSGDAKLNRLLQVRPNRFMSSFDFVYKLITRLYLYNNAFAYLDRDGSGNVRAIYPITATRVNILSDGEGSLFCGFMLRTGRECVLPYDDVVHLRRFYNDGDILGEDNSAISPGIELAQTQNEGIIQSIKAGASIRGILSFTQILSPSKLKEEKQAFIDDYLSMSNEGGIVAVDNKMDYKPLESKPVLLDAEQTKQIRQKIFSYLGICEAIVNADYTEDQYSAFYESVLEPISIALSQEFTAKVFNEREQSFGNSIVFESSHLQFTSNKTKVELISKLAPYGLLTINQALAVLALPSVPDGDRRMQALNVIDQALASEYQIGRVDNRLKGNDDDTGEA